MPSRVDHNWIQPAPFALQIELTEGWFEIPGYRRYQINGDGDVRPKSGGPLVRTKVVRNGLQLCLDADTGQRRRITVRSLLLLAGFVNPPGGSKPVPGFDHLWATTSGQIWNQKAGRFLRQDKQRSYYKTTTVAGVSRRVHVLVCLAWHGPAPGPRHTVAHWNGNVLDNRPSNLRWATQSENEEDKKRHGRFNHDTRSWNRRRR